MDELEIYTLYDHPKDYPDHYVIKRDLIVGGGRVFRDARFHFQSTERDTCMEFMLTMGKVALAPDPTDDPVILMTFV